MDRRHFLLAGPAASVATGLLTQPAAALAGPTTTSRAEISQGDALNPPGIRTAGIRMVPVVGGKYKVWTKRLGSGPVKVLVLHGGPGFSHEYLEALESFLPEAGLEMYYYDQLGCNNSDHPDDTSLWTAPRYVEEVEEVRKGLGLDNFVLYGHSWGGMLALDYALKYQQHLRGLVISNAAASVDSALTHINMWKRQLSPASRARLSQLEATQDYDSPEYQRIMMEELYPVMICRLKPWPEPVTRTLVHANQTIYVQMQGKSEALVTGNLKDWDRWSRLSEIKVRTLTIGSRYDEMDPKDMEKMATSMPNATYAYCPNGAHLCMWDDQAVYFQHLLKFLRSV